MAMIGIRLCPGARLASGIFSGAKLLILGWLLHGLSPMLVLSQQYILPQQIVDHIGKKARVSETSPVQSPDYGSTELPINGGAIAVTDSRS